MLAVTGTEAAEAVCNASEVATVNSSFKCKQRYQNCTIEKKKTMSKNGNDVGTMHDNIKA